MAMEETIVTGNEVTAAVINELCIKEYNSVRIFCNNREVNEKDLKIIIYNEDTKSSNDEIISAYVSGEHTKDNKYPHRVHIEQYGETKEYEHYKTETDALKRVEHINSLCTSDWNML